MTIVIYTIYNHHISSSCFTLSRWSSPAVWSIWQSWRAPVIGATAGALPRRAPHFHWVPVAPGAGQVCARWEAERSQLWGELWSYYIGRAWEKPWKNTPIHNLYITYICLSRACNIHIIFPAHFDVTCAAVCHVVSIRVDSCHEEWLGAVLATQGGEAFALARHRHIWHRESMPYPWVFQHCNILPSGNLT